MRVDGRLAEILVLDQFSRNMYRSKPQAFAHDAMALALAQEAVAAGVDQRLSVKQCCFLYLPYMHSESPRVHEEAMRLFDRPGFEQQLDFERQHRAIIVASGAIRIATPCLAAHLLRPNSNS